MSGGSRERQKLKLVRSAEDENHNTIDEHDNNTSAIRLSPPTYEHLGRAVINIDSYVPYFFASINNSLSRGASQRYLKDFGIGIVEWRIVAMLAIEPEIPASRISEVIALDKSATSRGLKDLANKGVAIFQAQDSDPRRRVWWLSEAGYELHDRILKVALARERQLLQGVDAADLEIAVRVMRIMRKNARALSSGEGT